MTEEKRTEESLTFEEALRGLEEIVENLEQGDVPLEKALSQFQKGVGLANFCQQTLKDAERTLTKMVNEHGEETLFETTMDMTEE